MQDSLNLDIYDNYRYIKDALDLDYQKHGYNATYMGTEGVLDPIHHLQARREPAAYKALPTKPHGTNDE